MQVRPDGGLDQGGTVEMQRNNQLLKVVPTGVSDAVNVKCERKRSVKDDVKGEQNCQQLS